MTHCTYQNKMQKHFISEPIYWSVVDHITISKKTEWYPPYAQKLYSLRLSDNLENPEDDIIASFYFNGNLTYYWRNKILHAERVSTKKIESVEYLIESENLGRNTNLNHKMFFVGYRSPIIFCYESTKPSEDKIIEGILNKPEKFKNSNLQIQFKV